MSRCLVCDYPTRAYGAGVSRWMLFAVVLLISNMLTGYASRRTPPKIAVQPETANAVRSMYKIDGPFIVILGDSITAAAPLPASVCGVPLINAAKGGSRASNFIPFAEELNAYGLAPALVVVALGVNDALPAYRSDFRASYGLLLDRLPHVPVALATLAPTDSSMEDGKRYDAAALRSIDDLIRAMAAAKSAALIDLAALKLETRDGLHPTIAGYPVWVDAVVTGIENAMRCRASK